MATVSVLVEGKIIHAVYKGAMTMDVVLEGERLIEEALRKVPAGLILYDTLAMDPPSMKLAMEMKSFDGRIRSRVTRSATVVHDAGTAFMAKVAFALSSQHKVFYNDLGAAYAWLEGR